MTEKVADPAFLAATAQVQRVLRKREPVKRFTAWLNKKGHGKIPKDLRERTELIISTLRSL